MRLARLYAILGAVLAILEGGGMNTRKGFIRDGFGIAAILAAQSSPAILVRSIVAARGSFFGRVAGGGGWVNPYVTDGLVAMWDGEWNAGGGVHDGSIENEWTAQGSSNYYFTGEACAIRFYSRPLSAAEEVAANYAIDKARFNLP